MRIEHDSMGEIQIEDNNLWGAQTQRSFENFKIGKDKQPIEIIKSFAILKSACASANYSFGLLDKGEADEIIAACDDIYNEKYNDQFPLVVYQTGSGTQSNMNVNEVIANIAKNNGTKLHPNDHVNKSQSSNDTFPSAMNIACTLSVVNGLIPACHELEKSFDTLMKKYGGIVKIGRTHLMDAVPLSFSQELSGWKELVSAPTKMIEATLPELKKLAIGGTAVGTGLNAPIGFDKKVCKIISEKTCVEFIPDENKFHALSSRDCVAFTHGAIKTLATNLLKIANDIRWLASGPRCGLGEIKIPANEPGSSIMPGKVNPTQCEALSMVCVKVMGNDSTISIANSQGNFQLNVYQPLIANTFIESVNLLIDAMNSFRIHLVDGIIPNKDKMNYYLNQSLMLVTCLSPKIGYENAAKCVQKTEREGITLKEAVLSLGMLDESEYDKIVDPSKMI